MSGPGGFLHLALSHAPVASREAEHAHPREYGVQQPLQREEETENPDLGRESKARYTKIIFLFVMFMLS
jgi:hypothetical protein